MPKLTAAGVACKPGDGGGGNDRKDGGRDGQDGGRKGRADVTGIDPASTLAGIGQGFFDLGEESRAEHGNDN
jgi:hypothetical protein